MLYIKKQYNLEIYYKNKNKNLSLKIPSHYKKKIFALTFQIIKFNVSMNTIYKMVTVTKYI